MTDPIRPIGPRDDVPGVTPVQRRRPRDDDEREREREQRHDQPRRNPPRRPSDPERLIDVEA
jgi:hypothetical protein